jgi:hypothetical protein
MKFRVPEIVLGALLAVAVVAVGMLFSSQHSQQGKGIDAKQGATESIQGHSDAQRTLAGEIKPVSQQQQSDGHGGAYEWYGVKPGEFLLFLATVGLWAATMLLVRDARKTAERQLRAYVHLKYFEVREIPSPWGVKGIHATIPTIFLTWENTGQTPTRNALSNSNWAAFADNIPNDFQFPDDPDHGPFTGLLGPGQTQELNPRTIPIQILKEAAAQKAKIYVWGWIEYNDVFVNTRRHRTEFAARLEVTGLPGHVCHYGLRIYSEHNGADDECMKPVQTRYK